MPTAKGRKEDDRKTFPLCTVHYGPDGKLTMGCHFEFDQYQILTRDNAHDAAIRYGLQTRQMIRKSGNWPKHLPHLEEQLELENV